MGQLMGQGVAQHGFVLRRPGGQVNCGAEEAEDAGGGDGGGHIYGKQTVRGIQRPAAAPQTQCQMEVAGNDDRGHHRHAQEPEHEKLRLHVQFQGLLCLFRSPLLRHHRIGLLPPGFIILQCFAVGRIVFLFVQLLVGGEIDLPHRGGEIHPIRHRGGADGAVEELEGDQKPHQHHQPQGVLQAQADPAPQGKPHRQHRGDGHRGGDDPVIHHGAAPPRLCG